MNEDFKTKFTQLLKDVSEIKTICTDTKTKLERITEEVAENQRNIDRLKGENADTKRLDELEQYSRKYNVIIECHTRKKKI